MADDSSKAARRPAGAGDRSRRRGSRLKVAGKLTALLGLPLLILFGIFASGLYFGATRADRVVELEQRWLGIEPPPGRLLGTADQDRDAAEPEPELKPADDAEPPVDDTKPPADDKPEPKPVTDADPTPTPDASTGLPVAKAVPVGAELESQFNKPQRARVKIMVDPALVAASDDWFSEVAELFEATQASFEPLFGIQLQLQAVVVWDAADGANATALLNDLATRERDGADLVLGLVAREQPPGFTPTLWTDDLNGDHALVFADAKQGDRHYRSMLRALAMLFGAEPTLDSAARQLGSFMSDAALPSGTAPVIDPKNRGLVVFNKRRPFASVESRQPPADDDDGEANAGETN